MVAYYKEKYEVIKKCTDLLNAEDSIFANLDIKPIFACRKIKDIRQIRFSLTNMTETNWNHNVFDIAQAFIEGFLAGMKEI